MELRQLRQFVVLSETLNFHRAAERLHMAQPPLSVSLKKLEGELGARLFERTTRGVKLTTFGRTFLLRARRILFEADEALATARATVSGEEGTLTIGFVGSATYSALPSLVPAYRAAYPRVEMILRESTTTEILNDLGRQAIDLGIVRTPLARASNAALEAIEDDHLFLALPAAHALAHGDDVSLADVREEPFILYSPQTVPSLHAIVMLACQQAGFTPRVAQEAIQVQTIISLVESGLGVALVPATATRSGYARTVFRRVANLGEAARVQLAIAFLPEWETIAARRFRDLAAAQARTKGRKEG